MRIVSWNVQKGSKPVDNILTLVEGWGADVAIFQEPTGGLLGADSKTRTPRGGTKSWSIRAYTEGNYQGYIVVATTGDVTLLSIGGVQVPGAVTDNRLVIVTVQHTTTHETVRVATCHVPFSGGVGGVASTYVQRAMGVLEARYDDLAKHVDVFMGDFNTYGVQVPGTGQKYAIRLASPTGGGGTGGALDKIVTDTGKQALFAQCGRVVPQQGASPPAHDAPSVNVVDLTESSWDGPERVLNDYSDHLPIYLDTGGDAPQAQQGPPAQNVPKRAKFDDFQDPPKLVTKKQNTQL